MVWLKCKFCNHVWFYKGSHRWATCPRCLGKNKVAESRFVPWFQLLYHAVQREFEEGNDLEIWLNEHKAKIKCGDIEIAINDEKAYFFVESIKQWAFDEQFIVFPSDVDELEKERTSDDESEVWFRDDAGNIYRAKRAEIQEDDGKTYMRIFSRVKLEEVA